MQRGIDREWLPRSDDMDGWREWCEQFVERGAQGSCIGSIDDATRTDNREAIPVDHRGCIAGMKPAQYAVQSGKRMKICDARRGHGGWDLGGPRRLTADGHPHSGHNEIPECQPHVSPCLRLLGLYGSDLNQRRL